MLAMNSALEKIQKLESTAESALQMQSHILILRKHEKDFLMRKDVKYIDKFNKTYAETEQIVNRLNVDLEYMNHNTQHIQAIVPILNQYHKSFNALTELQKSIGLNPKDGLYGSLRSSVHDAESLLKEYHEIQLTADMLMLRRNEKDFMLRFAEKYRGKFLKNFDKFEQNLTQSNLDNATQQAVSSAMNQYKTQFLNLFDAEQIKGLDEKSGLQGQMRAAIHATAKPLDVLQTEIKAFLLEQNNNIQSLLWSIAIVALIIILFVLLQTTRKVLNGVSILTLGMTNTKKTGDFSQPIQHKLRDEFGDIANTYNDLLASIADEINHINHIMDAIVQGDFKQRINEQYNGDFEQLRLHLNESVSSVDNTMLALEEIMTALENGQFNVRMNANVKGSLKAKVDHSMDFLESALTEIQTVMSHVAQGQFDKRIENQLPGNLAVLKDSINNSVSEVDRAFVEIAEYADALASNDLTHLMTGEFKGSVQKVQNDLNNAMHNLANTIKEVDDTAIEVEKGANLISETNASLNQRIQEEAASLEQTAAAIEQMTVSVKQSTDNSLQASQVSHATRGEAEKGQEVMQSTIRSMHEIQASSNKIEEIVTLIDSIAFQTNLLALNAAVEAARAGEQGRGFAVVAGEVRSLAGKSSDAAKDIKLLIDEISTKVAKGSQLAEQSGEAFSVISGSINKVADIVEEISASGAEQAKGIGEVNQAMSSMDAIAQKNATMVESSAEHSVELKHDAELLKRLVDKFTTSHSKALIAA